MKIREIVEYLYGRFDLLCCGNDNLCSFADSMFQREKEYYC